MQLYGVLTILLVALSTAYGLRCYTCITTNPKECTQIMTCSPGYNYCFSIALNGEIMKGCVNTLACDAPMTCCKGDLCNGAIPTGPSAVLLLVSSAIITLFL